MFQLWTNATNILGTIRAEEALDLLIGCLYCNSGEGGYSVSFYPALNAVIQIGKPAIPKLALALSSADVFTRQYAAWALGDIGGMEAKGALEQALVTEKDERVITQIRISLNAIHRQEAGSGLKHAK